MNIRTVLVPTDFSDVADRAILEGVALAQRLRADLTLFHVVENDPLFTAYGPMEGMTIEAVQYLEEAQRRSAANLEERATAIRQESGLTVGAEVALGNTSREIVRRAGIRRDVLVCMATHGRSGFEAAVLGSVSERVVRACDGPVWISRGTLLGEPSAQPTDRALCVVDLTDESLAIVPKAAAVAAGLGVPIEFAYVFDESITQSLIRTVLFPLRNPDEMTGHSVGEVKAMLEMEVAKRLPEATAVNARVLEGHPAEAITEASADTGLVIIGTHGRSGVARAIIGSVAERVVRSAKSSVLVLRAREKE